MKFPVRLQGTFEGKAAASLDRSGLQIRLDDSGFMFEKDKFKRDHRPMP